MLYQSSLGAASTVGKQDAIAATLREEIVRGGLTAGAQLPACRALAKRFDVSVITVQLALKRLAREGYVEAHSRKGTFVTAHSPQASEYGLVFWNDPALPFGWSKFYAALTNEALALQRDGLHFQFFHGIQGQATNHEDHQRLFEYLRGQRLAGLILLNWLPQTEADAFFEACNVPCVALSGLQLHPRTPAVTFDGDRLLERAVAFLAGQGRKRIAYLGIGIHQALEDVLARAAAKVGAACPAYWQLAANQYEPQTAKQCVQLLLRGDKSTRPDGLVIGDDNLVEHALAGVVAAGVSVPSELEIVTHCNFPWLPASVLPVQRLGFDMRQALTTCVALLERQRRGETISTMAILPPRFEAEPNLDASLAPAAELPAPPTPQATNVR